MSDYDIQATANMCNLRCKKYLSAPSGCGHSIAVGILRCGAAFRRPGQTPCVPESGNLRDLERDVDDQDRNLEGRCAVCLGETPPSSQGSDILEII